MKILLLTTFVALASADISELFSQQANGAYGFQSPLSSYATPQASIIGGPSNALSYSSSGSLSLPAATAGSFNGPSLGFTSGFPSNVGDGLAVQSFSNFPSGGVVSSTASPLNADFSGGFVSSTPASGPSVNFVQYSQQQPALSASQFASDASLNSGFGASLSGLSGLSSNLGSIGVDSNAARFSGIGGSISNGFGLNGAGSGISSYTGQISAGSLDESFSVAADAASSGADSQSEVSKHLYFFAAPEEPEEEIQSKIDLAPVPPKKSYKIIFIKAPSYRLPSTINVPAQAETEEKTLVYVLIKKPEVNSKVRYQGAIPAKPSKPEVFFIKYKTQKEAETAVAEIQSKHGAQGQVIANLPASVQLASPQAEAIAANAAAVATGGAVAGDFGANAAANVLANALSSSSAHLGTAGAGIETRLSADAAHEGDQGVSQSTSLELNIPEVSSTTSTNVDEHNVEVGHIDGVDSHNVEAHISEHNNDISGVAGAEEHVVSIGGGVASEHTDAV